MKKFLLVMAALLLPVAVSAQSNIRYVKENGQYANSGLSWAQAKNNIQDAINDLVAQGVEKGEVWVAAGTYKPTESTESGGSTLYMSFKVPAGITVRGGFAGTENNPGERETQDFNSIGWFYKNQTILSGNLSANAEFPWDPKKEQWAPTFYGNCYHVVWFAMNGFDANGRAKGLARPAAVEGCVIEGGHAYNNSISERKHNAYGGGAYMVANSTLQNCYVRNCDASRDGGGVYMDGGGMLIHSYICDSQALGIGVDHGYGGGVCMEGSNQPGTHPIVVTGSGITNCVGRMGGGIATKVDKNCLKWRDNLAINATLVNNNTATTEGGGVYMLRGGAMANATITRNKCNGTGVTSNGMVTGRAGGVYARDNAAIANTVIWGNHCKANRDIQYASSRSSASNDLKPIFYYNSISKNDMTDWSGTTKMGVKSLNDDNTGTVSEGNPVGFPIFRNPTPEKIADKDATGAGQYFDFNEATYNYDLDKDGYKNKTIKIPMSMANLLIYSWKTSAESALHHAGINTYDLVKTLEDNGSLVPEVSTDITGENYNPRSTIGAYTATDVNIAPNTTLHSNTADFFVDPDFFFGEHIDHAKGDSWTTPTRFLGNVFEYIEAERGGALNGITTINIHVKQGTVDNTDSKKTGHIRTVALDVPSGVNVYGSYSRSLTGDDLSSRNPVLTPTIISGELLEDYQYYVAHLININNKENVLIDGFKLTFANAESNYLDNTSQNGAAITIKGSTNNIKFKNLTISNCKAISGPAIYADASTASFENCIFHNNTAFTANDVNGDPRPVNSERHANRAIVSGVNGSHLTFDHCDVVRNVGHASYLEGSTTNTWTNTIFYANLSQAVDDTNTNIEGAHALGLPSFTGTTANATGNHCMFDASSASFSTNFGGNDTGNKWQYNLQYKFQDGTGQGYPRFINPTKNAGVSEQGDVTFYGRSTSFEPHNNNPVINVASADGEHYTWGKDITDITTRDFGGLPDIGAVENHKSDDPQENAYKDGQSAYGSMMYVRDYNTYDSDGNLTATDTNTKHANGTERDGSSWTNAINGNATYHLASGTRQTFTLATPQASTSIANKEHIYKIGMLYNNTPGNSVYYAYNSGTNGNYLNSTILPEDGDEFILLSTGYANQYYIYDLTKSKYCYYTDTSEGKGKVQLKDDNSGSTKWYLRQHSSAANYLTYIIIPGTLSNSSNSSQSWNYHGGTSYNLGLYPGWNDSNGKWQFYEVGEESFTTETNGLQYAIDQQSSLWASGDNREVWVAAGIYPKDPDGDAQSCYIIRDHVNVIGAFPKTGNPAMDQRQALVSQYVKVVTGYDYKDYETIIEPVTKTIETDVTRRVLAQPWANNPKNGSYTDYNGAEWNGFTIRHGVLDCAKLKTDDGRDGGGGVALYRNVKLVNCVVTNNTALWKSAESTQNIRAGGVYMDGGTVAGCYLINNLLEGYSTTAPAQNGAAYGGGMYLYSGTVYNTVIANNRIYSAHSDGAGAFMENATFFNNTIVNNKAEGTNRACGGIAIWTSGPSSTLNMYNSIIVNNEGKTGGTIGNKNVSVQQKGGMYLYNCLTEATGNLSGTNAVIQFNNCTATTNFSDLFEHTGSYSDRSSNGFRELDLRLKSTATVAINKGIGEPTINDVTYDLSEYNDMDYRDRIQDCTIDIGAYEYNGSYAISPDVTSVSGQAIFYVTPNGYGTSSGHDPENAACASKLQKVIDAAGRYKYSNPTKQVIVKVANDYALDNDDDDNTYFTYYATRTTDFDSQDVRVWSIIVPRGVEIWGGYTDVARTNHTRGSWSNDDNGFYRLATEDDVTNKVASAVGDMIDLRDVTDNPTYFDSYYVNKQEKSSANTYHVVTFTDHIFDGDGYPYLTKVGNGTANDDVVGGTSSYASHDVSGSLAEGAYITMSSQIGFTNVYNQGTEQDPKIISNRAVLDGIFISGGQADARDAAGGSSQKNINSYGGAAIVTDYAHVRNCILTGNSATYGGALALKDHALVSGSLFMENSASKHGGALYVFEEGAKLSDGTTIDSGTAGDGGSRGLAVMDKDMAHVFTSTIVNNKAKQGGGIWFTETGSTPNIRVNSSVIWQNTADDQANVAGDINPNKPKDDIYSAEEYYPFAYCALQNLRASGSNNLLLDNLNKAGARFSDKDHDWKDPETKRTTIAVEANEEPKFRYFGFYGLTNYSMLNNTGMPKDQYNELMKKMAVSATDFTGVSRTIETKLGSRTYVEIGARAIKKILPQEHLMLRLFVTEPDQVDMDAAQKMMDLANKAGADATDEYYAQEGSSFAYPFQSLQDALDYIVDQRQEARGFEIANNLPFEICLTGGTYYPSRDLSSHYGQSLANTFAIPEGVGIYGGFAIDELDDNTFYGAGNTPNASKLSSFTAGDKDEAHWVFDNVNALDETDLTLQDKPTDPTWTLTVMQLPINDMLIARKKEDNNSNNIIEPWEFLYQTVLSGNTTNAENSGVYHVLTAVADQNVVGMLPKASIVHGHYEDHTGDNPTCKGYEDHEEGQTIRLNGLTITGGYARHFTEGSLDTYGKYIYYQGGGLQVDGNRYNDNYNKVDDTTYGPEVGSHPACVNGLGAALFNEQHRAAYAVGYRDIPLSITDCKFINNQGGYGGAISSNGTLDIFQCSFEQNLAVADSEPEVDEHGNDLYVQYPGNGGAILSTHQLSAFNTLFANNEARSLVGNSIEPYFHTSFRVPDPNAKGGKKTLDAAGGAICNGTAGKFHFVNCNFVRNKANMYPAVYTLNPNYDMKDVPGYPVMLSKEYSQFTNTVFWGNEVNKDVLEANKTDEYFTFGAKLNVNYGLSTRGGAEYDPSFGENKSPRNQEDLDANFEETAWFSAYEPGTGITAVNNKDMRDLDYKPYLHGKFQITNFDFDNPTTDYTGGLMAPGFSPLGSPINEYQNCNISIDPDNEVLEGPNFVNPATTAGYDGYYESADWSPARLNSLVDMGSGKISQTIHQSTDPVSGQPVYTCTFDRYDEGHPVPADRVAYSSEKAKDNPLGYPGDFRTYGAYTMTHYVKAYPEYAENLAIGNEYYMQSAYVQDNGTQQDLYRISYDPNPTHNQTYIDIGVYEYPHTPLNFTTEGDEVDVIWVSSAEKPDNGLPDGSDWTQPTSDLQRAIETLLASRNGHRKEIRLMDGTFTPIYTIEDKLGFIIDTEYLNGSVTIPTTGSANEHYVKSFTVKGGYSRDVKGRYDVEEYPAIMRAQHRTDGTSERWNNLFYIKDATQRYDDGSGPNNGAQYEADSPINTIPIEIDGVTFINDQAKAETKGSAIYYPDTEVDMPTSANISTAVDRIDRVYYTTAEKKVVSNTETEYYDDVTIHTWVTNATPDKLVISKCKFVGNGTSTASGLATPDAGKIGSAVYIGTKGGSSLIFNSVFHSNYSNPLEAYNTVTINNTFAKNAGWVWLKNEDEEHVGYKQSAVRNSILWQNNMGGKAGNGTIGKQFSLNGETDWSNVNVKGTNFQYNAFTGGDTQETDYAAGQTIANNNYNVGLTESNTDVIYGPNFVNPGTDADLTIDQLMQRSFHLQPSMRLVNKGKNELYNDKVAIGSPASYNTAATIYDMAWVTTTDTEAASDARISNVDIDLGAYEYQQELKRVIYVNPNNALNGDGTSWESPLGYGHIQDAIDLAGVYYINSVTDLKRQGERAYVFVKGASTTNKGMNTGEAITFRNGVTVIGSVASNYDQNCETEVVDEKDVITDGKLATYLTEMLAQREGVASNAASKTTVTGIYTNGTAFTQYNPSGDKRVLSLIDGFDVTAVTDDNPTGKTDKTLIKIDPYKNEDTKGERDVSLCLRNIIVHDNDATGSGQNLVELNNCLLYDVLMRDNKVDNSAAVLKVEKYGYLTNGTIEGKTVYTDNSDVTHVAKLNGGTLDEQKASRIHASLVNFDYYNGSHDFVDPATKNTFSGYNYPLEDKNLNYQLAEGSKHIDAIPNDQNALCETLVDHACYRPSHYLPKSLLDDDFIRYDKDRDLLGNPRQLDGVTTNSAVDRGCFETWKVEKDFICGSGTGHTSTSTIAAQHYPHDGSVVYIMEGKSLVIDPLGNDDVNSTAHNPGYMLLQKGASFYGNGRNVTCAYLAVERSLKEEGNVVSMPFAMQYNTNVAVPSYSTNDDEIGVLTLDKVNGTVYSYNGAERADWKYDFHDANSPCWTPAPATVEANKAVLYVPDAAKTVARFTAKGASMTDYIYTETTDASKTVTLTQYNDGGRDTHENGNTGNNADFTDADDMGWNAIGLPYLVSQYKPYETVSDAMATGSYGYTNETKGQVVGKYMMHTPKTLWMFYDGEKYADGSVMDPSTEDDAGDGGFYAVDSWENTAAAWHVSSDAEARIWVGEGFFTQTATFDATENLTFFRPVAPASFPASARNAVDVDLNARYYVTTDVRPAMEEDFTGKQIVATRYYTADGVQHARPVRGVTIQVDIYDDGSRQTRKFSKR